jgi:FKBP-type peptidyl-prolyl cis-trans isomerase
MAKVTKLRITLGGMMLVVALAALAINYFRPETTRIIDFKVGTGPMVKPGDVVSVHYVGKLDNGTEFDSTKKQGQPFEVEIGLGRLIKGMDMGLVGMQVGGVRQLVIPPAEAYGVVGHPPVIPPNSLLRFEVELIGIR